VPQRGSAAASSAKFAEERAFEAVFVEDAGLTSGRIKISFERYKNIINLRYRKSIIGVGLLKLLFMGEGSRGKWEVGS
jgi:hypothetical protein